MPTNATPAPTVRTVAMSNGSLSGSGGKARPGELRAKVARTLAAASAPLRVTELVAILGHSGGAIGNACEALVARGKADRVSSRPRRYRAIGVPCNAPACAAGTTSPAPPVASGGRPTVTRPNGQQYHPRKLAQLPDIEALRRLREAGVPVLLYGPPGTGKTSLVEAAYPDLITVAGDGDTAVADLVGEYTQTDDGGYEFIYGPLITAMQEGRPLLLDDATLISPKVLAAMYPAMDGRRQIQVKAHKGETITAAAGFYVVAGHNPGVHGAILSEALASRFSVQIQVSSDYDLTASLKINRMAVRIARNLATRQQAGEIGWAPQLRELIAFQKVADVLGLEAAFANLVGIAPLEDRDLVAEIVTKATGRPVTALALGPQL